MVTIGNKKFCENCFTQTEREPCPVCGFGRERYNRDPMVLPVGSILGGRYAIGRVIGKGSFGITYLVYDMKMECKVAVKEYFPRGVAVRSPGGVLVSAADVESERVFKKGADTFFKEARSVARFRGNPSIVSIRDGFYENGTVYFTMDYLEGQTLKSYLQEYGALSAGQAVCVADAVSNALMAAHSLNVLHKDISLDNIMVCRDGTVKLIDFGAARQALMEESRSPFVVLRQGFVPLEQYQRKGRQGPWTDMYSLGATLYYALTLDALCDPITRMEDDGEWAYGSGSNGIADGLWQVIRKAAALRIQDRYQNIYELKGDLNRLSIQPVPLVKAGKSKGRETDGPTAKAFGGMGHAETKADAAQRGYEMPGDDLVGMTRPLEEEDPVGVTKPLKEEEPVGVAKPCEEEGSMGVTRPLEEELCYEFHGDCVVITGRTGLMENVLIPDIIQGKPVTEIGRMAFYFDQFLHSIRIPYGVTKIGWECFGHNNLESIELPESVTEICAGAFEGCSRLAGIKISDGVTEISERAFCGCGSLTGIKLPHGITKIGYHAFWDCKSLTDIELPFGVTEIGCGAFWGCGSLRNIRIPKHTYIGEEAFEGCHRLTVTRY